MQDERNQLLTELYEKYYDSVFLRCYHQVGYQAHLITMVEDCVHDAFVKALQHYEIYKDFDNPMGWIAETAKHRIMSEYRKQKSRENPVYLHKMAVEQERQEDMLLQDMDRWLEQEQSRHDLETILNLLTEQESLVYHAYFEKDLSLKETVELTGFSANTVRSAVGRIRRRAKRFFHISIFIFFMRCIFHF